MVTEGLTVWNLSGTKKRKREGHGKKLVVIRVTEIKTSCRMMKNGKVTMEVPGLTTVENGSDKVIGVGRV